MYKPGSIPDMFLTEIWDRCMMYGPKDCTVKVEGRAPMTFPTFLEKYGSRELSRDLFKGRLVLFGVVVRTGLAAPNLIVEQRSPGKVPVTHFFKRPQ